jgi:dipeptidyl aminopeptidase/acylaminoacyl peptidase
MPEPDRELAQRILADVAPPARRRLRWVQAVAIGLLLIAGVVAGGLLRRAAERHRPVATTPVVRHAQPPLRRASEVATYSRAGLQLFDLNDLGHRLFITMAEMSGSQLEVGRWSPGNDRFAFTTAACPEPCVGAQLYIKDSGRPARRVPTGGYPIAWAPDGSALAVERPAGVLAVIDPETLAARVVPAGAHGWEPFSAWIDDGRAFLALRRDNDGGSTLVRIDRATLAATPVAPPNHFPCCAQLQGAPDGNSAALMRSGNGGWMVELIDRDGRRRTVGSLPLSGAYSAQLAWSPDGTKLAVNGAIRSRAGQGAIWVVDIASAKARRLATLPSRAWESSIRWLPGTRGIAVLPLEGRAYAVTLDGRNHGLPQIIAANLLDDSP